MDLPASNPADQVLVLLRASGLGRPQPSPKELASRRQSAAAPLVGRQSCRACLAGRRSSSAGQRRRPRARSERPDPRGRFGRASDCNRRGERGQSLRLRSAPAAGGRSGREPRTQPRASLSSGDRHATPSAHGRRLSECRLQGADQMGWGQRDPTVQCWRVASRRTEEAELPDRPARGCC